MNINRRFLEEAKALEDHWAKIDPQLFKELQLRQSTAILLECERLINEVSSAQESDKCPLREGGTCPVQLRGNCPNDGKCNQEH